MAMEPGAGGSPAPIFTQSTAGEPTPHPTPSAPPSPPDGPPTLDPEPQPRPSPGADPQHPHRDTGPDIGVSTGWLRARAHDCDERAEEVAKLRGPAWDALHDLYAAAPSWEFLGSVPQLEERWEDLHGLLHRRLHQAADNFRDNADRHDENETKLQSMLYGLHPEGG